MKIALASDHTGVSAKKKVRDLLDSLGVAHEDFGTNSEESVDYPDLACTVGKAVAEKACDQGILICGTGIGVGIAANKVRGVRAATCHSTYTTEMARKHNDANVLCLGARVLSEDEAVLLVQKWLDTHFEAGRHQRRVQKICRIEQENL
jgi:ribose 5-phosphate isomerase B